MAIYNRPSKNARDILGKMYRNLEHRFKSMIDVPEDEWKKFLDLAKFRRFSPGEELPRNYLGYIEKGLFRAFYREIEGEDLIREFSREDDLICYLTMYQNEETEDLVFEAIEESEIFYLTVEELESLYAEHPCWEAFGRKSAEEAYLKKLRRERQLLGRNLESRYRQFCKDYPGLLNRAPQHMIASFLGVSPVSLSRIRGKIARSPDLGHD